MMGPAALYGTSKAKGVIGWLETVISERILWSAYDR